MFSAILPPLTGTTFLAGHRKFRDSRSLSVAGAHARIGECIATRDRFCVNLDLPALLLLDQLLLLDCLLDASLLLLWLLFEAEAKH